LKSWDIFFSVFQVAKKAPPPPFLSLQRSIFSNCETNSCAQTEWSNTFYLNQNQTLCLELLPPHNTENFNQNIKYNIFMRLVCFHFIWTVKVILDHCSALMLSIHNENALCIYTYAHESILVACVTKTSVSEAA
jgi:hypothetical protein